ncbi:MAG TPA: hypothetical protein VJ953_11920 [Saprospiraceae bacterium]|nr:hypothetical protein [Saprospiraceae bacterium]
MKSTGNCFYCGKSYTKTGISRHLATHLKVVEEVAKSSSFHLKINAGPYFLQLLMDGDAKMSDLDSYLRRIWLECCGHMSEFGYKRWSQDQGIEMNQKARRVLEKGMTIWYAYDFGSTTELDIACINKYSFPTKEKIMLLSRNNPLDVPCDACGKGKAKYLCTAHWGDEEMWFCEKCGKTHSQQCEDAEYAMGPIYNSPRTGICAYEGGSIDRERDQ